MEQRDHLKIGLALAFILVFFLILSAAPSAKSAEKPISLRVSEFVGPGHIIDTRIKEWAADTEKATGDRVKIDIYPGQALGKATEHWELAEKGVADLSHFCAVYTPDRFPKSGLMELPFCTPSSVMGSKLMADLYKKDYIASEYKTAKMLSVWTTSPAQVFSRKKITKLEDFKGVKIVGLGPVMGAMCKALNAVMVEMSYGDIYLALQRGVVDAAITNWAGGGGFKWFEVSKYAIELNLFGGWASGLVMNLGSWNKLPKDIQDSFQKVMDQKWDDRFGKMYDDDDARCRKLFENAKVEMLKLSKGDSEKLTKAALPVWEGWINSLENKGLQGKKIYEGYCGIMKQEGQEVRVKVPGLYK